MDIKPINEWKEKVWPVLESKQNEFISIGYDDVKVEHIWECLERLVWQGEKELPLHRVVQDIFHLTVTMYMDHMAVNALKGNEEDMMESIRSLMGEENKEN